MIYRSIGPDGRVTFSDRERNTPRAPVIAAEARASAPQAPSATAPSPAAPGAARPGNPAAAPRGRNFEVPVIPANRVTPTNPAGLTF